MKCGVNVTSREKFQICQAAFPFRVFHSLLPPMLIMIKVRLFFSRQHISSVNKLCWSRVGHYLTWTIMTIGVEAKNKKGREKWSERQRQANNKQTKQVKDKLLESVKILRCCSCRTFLGKFIMLRCLELFLFLSNIVLLLSWEGRCWVRTEPSGEIVGKINISFIFP